MPPPIRTGVVGTGFISRHFALTLEQRGDLRLSRVLTRRDPESCSDYVRPDLLTNSLAELIDNSDVLVECSGDPIYATEVIAQAVSASLPVVTMNAEFHVTAGSAFVGTGLVTEAAGDQPGCTAELAEEAREMGFRPLVYGNMKGFLDTNPTRESMEYWATRQGISLPMVTSFTDGTKVQIEQALVANGLGATVATSGLLGLEEDDLNAASQLLAEEAKKLGRSISDYVLSRALPHGVFLVAEHDERQTDALKYLKLGDGPFYTLVRNNIFVHLEIAKTVKRILHERRVLLDNSPSPTVSVAAVAKRPIQAGTKIQKGIGSFELRGTTVMLADHQGHVPIGLIADAVAVADVDPGEIVTFDHVEIPETLALKSWRSIEATMLGGH